MAVQARVQRGWGFATMSKRLPFQVREHIFLLNSTHLLIILFILFVLDKKGSPLCRLKIYHASEFESCVYSWCTGLHGSEQYSCPPSMHHSILTNWFKCPLPHLFLLRLRAREKKRWINGEIAGGGVVGMVMGKPVISPKRIPSLLRGVKN